MAIVAVSILAIILVAVIAAPPLRALEPRSQKAAGIVRAVNTDLGYLIIEHRGEKAIYVLEPRKALYPGFRHIEGRQVTIEYQREFGAKVVTHVGSGGNR